MALLSIFKKKEEETSFEGRYILVRPTEHAIESYIQDEFNMEIAMMEGDRVLRIFPFSVSQLKAIRNIYPDLPVMTQNLSEEYEMQFEPYFGEAVL